MKTVRIIIFIFFLIGMLNMVSCCKESGTTYDSIPEHFKLKVNYLDTSIFVSDLGNYDTLFVVRLKHDIVKENYDKDNKCEPWHYYERLIIDYFKVKDKKDSVFGSVNQYPPEIYMKGFYEVFDNVYNTAKFSIQFHDLYTFSDSIYENVTEFEHNFLINPDYGFIRYETEKGEIFELFKYIKAE